MRTSVPREQKFLTLHVKPRAGPLAFCGLQSTRGYKHIGLEHTLIISAAFMGTITQNPWKS